MWVRWWFSAGKRESGLLCESGYQRTQMNRKKARQGKRAKSKSSISDSWYWFTRNKLSSMCSYLQPILANTKSQL